MPFTPLHFITISGQLYYAAPEVEAEIARLREGLQLITCEPINAEYMAQNILDGRPPYYNTMLVDA